ncbi:ankyrin repeat domain-containing protein [Xylocopilactobacillus apicola]|uniref:Ankyrin repeat domain-containing protein n=1 Tax=Xylocopilactobacillus apicola TaxID=2932184 RepID=A0AAU9DUS4_9LACO|nr:ankyrin repeat domain-containing protein [Xylocopilactobacillus apicola]BDR57618.1 hypothetical protein XA3_00590 [Xylocopilactobacillus apicola]
MAAINDQTESLKILIDAGAKIDIQDNEGNTPLWRAAMRNRKGSPVIDALMEAGANPAISNNHGVSAQNLLGA